MSLTLASWNVNSVKIRTEHVLRFMKSQQPDLLLLQELKSTNETFPHETFPDYPHQVVVGQPSYNGVGILSKVPFKTLHTSLPGMDDDPQARYIEIMLDGPKPWHIINIYAPNGNPVSPDSDKYPYKLRWLDALYRHARNLMDKHIPFLIAGDFNIIPTAIDCWDAQAWLGEAQFREETWQRWRQLLYLGLTDAFRALHPDQAQAYTFWDYQAGCWPRNNGIRIDHALLSPTLADALQDCFIDRTPRGEEKPSDHTPLLVRLGN